MQQLQVLAAARRCPGPKALVNDAAGKPDLARHGYSKPGEGRRGQLVYYFQAADRFKHPQNRKQYMRALRFVNLSKSAGLHGTLGIFLGMRVRLTKKVLGPQLVQEASGENVGIVFHPEECFGNP